HTLGGLYDLQKPPSDKKTEVVGDKRSLKVKLQGSLQLQINGTKFILKNVLYVPDLMVNLFSVPQIVKHDVSMAFGKNTVTLHMDQRDPIKVPLSKNHDKKLYAVRLKPLKVDLSKEDQAKINHQSQAAMIVMKPGMRININKLHKALGHVSERTVRRTAKKNNWTVTGRFKLCEDCCIGKARKMNIPKRLQDPSNPSTQPGQRLYIDLSTPVKERSLFQGTINWKRYWLLIVDEFTRMKWSRFLTKKSNLPDEMFRFLMKLKGENYNVKYIRLDNAGENLALQRLVDKKGLGITFEYTAPHTPEQNGIVERAFATLYNRGRAMMSAAGFTEELKNKLWAECFNLATMLDAISSNNGETIPYELFYQGKNPRYKKYLHPFGELAFLTDPTKLKSKLRDRGFKAIFVGYNPDHSPTVFCFYDPETKRVKLSRNARFTGQMIPKANALLPAIPEDNDGSDADDDSVNVPGTGIVPYVQPNAPPPQPNGDVQQDGEDEDEEKQDDNENDPP
ncbi:MAG: hypothetical protein AAF587_44560, partial [Bacteroidota bacterium]